MTNTSRLSSTTRTRRTRLASMLAVLGVFAALLTLPATAHAEEADPTVEGRGALWARGEGDVEVEMQGRFAARVSGDVTIVDHAGDLVGSIHVGDTRQNDPAEAMVEETITDMTLTGFDGELRLRGSHFTVTVNGDVGLRAVGRGEATLDGDGVYKTRNGDRTVWDGRVALGDPAVQPA